MKTFICRGPDGRCRIVEATTHKNAVNVYASRYRLDAGDVDVKRRRDPDDPSDPPDEWRRYRIS